MKILLTILTLSYSQLFALTTYTVSINRSLDRRMWTVSTYPKYSLISMNEKVANQLEKLTGDKYTCKMRTLPLTVLEHSNPEQRASALSVYAIESCTSDS